MGTTTVRRLIDAPLGEVFHAVADIDGLVDVLPGVVWVEFLTPQRSGVGTRFRETRTMQGKEVSSTLKVTEFVDGERLRLVSHQGGTVWDTVFTVREVEDQTELTIVMRSRARHLGAGLLNPLFRGALKKALAQDMDAIKSFCER